RVGSQARTPQREEGAKHARRLRTSRSRSRLGFSRAPPPSAPTSPSPPRARRRRVLGLVGAAAGGGLYARGKLDERNEQMEVAETRIRSALDDLDPVARAQVLASLARSEF